MRWFKQMPAFSKNFYFIAGCLFLVWMLFFDSNDLITQYKLSRKLTNLEKQKEYYQEKIEEVKKDREELFSNQELLEKFAREKYLMKKENEDLYIIVEE
jgi:cell division protein FtsB